MSAWLSCLSKSKRIVRWGAIPGQSLKRNKTMKWKKLAGNRNAVKENAAKRTITLRVTDPEHAFLLSSAKSEKVSLSDWMRMRLFKKQTTHKNT
jgi:predicted HicB family RNase H-like nuclease